MQPKPKANFNPLTPLRSCSVIHDMRHNNNTNNISWSYLSVLNLNRLNDDFTIFRGRVNFGSPYTFITHLDCSIFTDLV